VRVELRTDAGADLMVQLTREEAASLAPGEGDEVFVRAGDLKTFA
jgi:hypothetical protein